MRSRVPIYNLNGDVWSQSAHFFLVPTRLLLRGVPHFWGASLDVLRSLAIENPAGWSQFGAKIDGVI